MDVAYSSNRTTPAARHPRYCIVRYPPSSSPYLDSETLNLDLDLDLALDLEPPQWLQCRSRKKEVPFRDGVLLPASQPASHPLPLTRNSDGIICVV